MRRAREGAVSRGAGRAGNTRKALERRGGNGCETGNRARKAAACESAMAADACNTRKALERRGRAYGDASSGLTANPDRCRRAAARVRRAGIRSRNRSARRGIAPRVDARRILCARARLLRPAYYRKTGKEIRAARARIFRKAVCYRVTA